MSKMTVSERIRQLGREGKSVSAIAEEVGVRYQHAYNVLRNAKLIATSEGAAVQTREIKQQPVLTTDILLASGFIRSAVWTLSGADEILTDMQLPRAVGVYAFAKNGIAMYVGVATMGMAKRLYFYRKPGISQRTSLRINAMIKSECGTESSIEVFTAIPADFEWNGLPVNGAAGLELGLIKHFSLPWNIRSAG